MWLLFIATMVLSFYASWRVRATFNHFSQVGAGSGFTGAQAAQRILAANGIYDVEVVPVQGVLTDHYDPIHKRLALSEPVYYSASVAALGVAAHEAGHAIQHQQAYAPLHLRMSLVKVQGIASQTVTWLPIIGLASGMLPLKLALWIIALGWGAIMLFNLVTLPVEFDASSRAEKCLSSMGIIRSEAEAHGVHKVLRAAAWTYVAAFITSLAYFLWYLLPLLTGGRRDE